MRVSFVVLLLLVVFAVMAVQFTDARRARTLGFQNVGILRGKIRLAPVGSPVKLDIYNPYGQKVGVNALAFMPIYDTDPAPVRRRRNYLY